MQSSGEGALVQNRVQKEGAISLRGGGPEPWSAFGPVMHWNEVVNVRPIIKVSRRMRRSQKCHPVRIFRQGGRRWWHFPAPCAPHWPNPQHMCVRIQLMTLLLSPRRRRAGRRQSSSSHASPGPFARQLLCPFYCCPKARVRTTGVPCTGPDSLSDPEPLLRHKY